MELPIRDAIPLSTDEHPNGDVPASALVDVRRNEQFPCLVAPEMAVCWPALRDAARIALGVDLVILAGGAYRDLDDQIKLFNERYEFPARDGLKATDYRHWQGKRYSLRADMAAAATPGTSNHGRGGAVDIALLADEKVVGITSHPAVFDWLLEHAHDFGLSWELQSEPWHLRVVGTVTATQISSANTDDDMEEDMIFKTSKTGDKIFAQDGAKAVRSITAFEGAVAEATNPGWATNLVVVDVPDDVASWLATV